jgi:ribonuclease-3
VNRAFFLIGGYLRQLIKKIVSVLTSKNDIDYEIPNLQTKMTEFQSIIKYKFKNEQLLIASLTHDSFSKRKDNENFQSNSPYERMEFMGDAVLGLIVAEHLFSKYPDKAEGFLSKLKSNIVSEKFLALKALDFNLGNYVLISDEEEKNGGRERKSILADTMEALICSIYLDGGLSKARKFITSFIIKGFEKQVLSEDLINYKSILQEYSQAKYQTTPIYELISETGPDHLKTFVMEVFVNSKKYGKGEGPNKKEAQQKAAQDACKRLKLN